MDTKTTLPMEEYMKRQVEGILGSEQIWEACSQELGEDHPSKDQVILYGIINGYSKDFAEKFCHT